MDLGKNYIEELKRRSVRSRISKKYQAMGLELAKILNDRKHKSLYIKLMKEGNPAKLMWLAADIADRKNVRNMGAYFMRLLPKGTVLPVRRKKKRQGRLRLKKKQSRWSAESPNTAKIAMRVTRH